MSKLKSNKMFIPASKPRNNLAVAVKKRHSGVHLSPKDKQISKGAFKNSIKKGFFD